MHLAGGIGLQCSAKLSSGLEALRRISLHALANDGCEARIKACDHFLDRLGRLQGDLEQQFVEGLRVERQLAGEALVADDTHRIEVTAMVDRLAAGLLGRHVVRRPHHGAGARHAHVFTGGGEL